MVSGGKGGGWGRGGGGVGGVWDTSGLEQWHMRHKQRERESDARC